MLKDTMAKPLFLFLCILIADALGSAHLFEKKEALSVQKAQPATPPTPLDSARLQQLIQTREERLNWWRDAKFGLFIHWGPSSIIGKEISWSRVGHPFDHKGSQEIPAEEYDQLYKRFNPVKFDADAWMQLAQDAGMKYVVLITKHHDGFAMWPTALSDYNIANTPFKRDICGEIAEAARKHGLKLGWYYSTRDWHHPDYLQGDNRKYDAFYRGQIEELLTRYGKVDVLWFDHVSGQWADWDFKDLLDKVYGSQQDILLNNRGAKFVFKPQDQAPEQLKDLLSGDFDTPEQKIGKFQTGRAWESCMTMTVCKDGGGWSYRPDGSTRSTKECIQTLVNCVTGDGNLLLNIGPLPTGEIDPTQVTRLKEIGQWLKKYGDAIYGTRGGPFRNDKWGGAAYKDDRIFIHILDPDKNTITLPAIPQKITLSKVLTGGNADVRQTDLEITISIPKSEMDSTDTIIMLKLDRSLR